MTQNNPFVISSAAEQHNIETEDGMLSVWIKPLSWIQQQEAMSKFVDFNLAGEEVVPKLDFSGYWRYIIKTCITETLPKLSQYDLINLKPEVGQKISKLLPQLTEIMSAIGGEEDPLE
tara:strand:- start:33672 stop:34025 length:354 start_codon:yes stop_codon:yes gene_type:complete